MVLLMPGSLTDELWWPLAVGLEGFATSLFPHAWVLPGFCCRFARCVRAVPFTLPAMLTKPATLCWSHSRLNWRFTHECASSGGQPGEHGEGIIQEQSPLLLMTPLIPAPALPGFVIFILICVQRSPSCIY